MILDIDKLTRWVDLLIHAEVHAIGLVLIGAGLCIHATTKDVGTSVIMAGLAIFRGGRIPPS